MQIHELKTKTKRKAKKVVGRGGKRGKTSGRGTKGQKARAGHRIRPMLRDTIKKIPKLRGESAAPRHLFKTEADFSVVLNLGTLNGVFASGEQVSPRTLLEKGLIKKNGNKMPAVKILAHGEFDKKLNVRGCGFSASAQEIIEKLGGTVR